MTGGCSWPAAAGIPMAGPRSKRQAICKRHTCLEGSSIPTADAGGKKDHVKGIQAARTAGTVGPLRVRHWKKPSSIHCAMGGSGFQWIPFSGSVYSIRIWTVFGLDE